MEIEKLAAIENATWASRQELFRLGTALLFIVGIMLFVSSRSEGVSTMLVIAGMIGGYMALNIAANDVADNVGPAVGSKALTLSGAILIAAIFEASGAPIAGGEVVGTIKGGIIDPALIAFTDEFVWVMMASPARQRPVVEPRDRIDDAFHRRRGARRRLPARVPEGELRAHDR